MKAKPQYNHLMSWLYKDEAETLCKALEEKFPEFKDQFEIRTQDTDNPKDCEWYVIVMWGRAKTKDVLIPAAWAEGWAACAKQRKRTT